MNFSVRTSSSKVQSAAAFKKSAGLRNEQIVTFQQRCLMPSPVSVTMQKDAPASTMSFDLETAILAVDVEGHFVRCLKLVEHEGGKHVRQARADIDGVLRRYPFKHLVRSITTEPRV